MIEGLVIRSTGSWYQVELEAGKEVVQARVPGRFRLDEVALTNPVAVGDQVKLKKNEDNTYTITEIFDRKNVLLRKAIKKSEHAQIIASNIDLALCVQAICKPKPKEGFIDRFLVTCEAYHIKPIIVFNKIDLAKKRDLAYLEDLTDTYSSLGYTVFNCSTLQKETIEPIQDTLKDQISVIVGHSGVGKSSLMNSLDPNLDLRTGEISSYSDKGMHTTTFATLHRFSFGGAVIDTPGIKEFGLYDIKPEELALYFADFEPFREDCKFSNCTHIHEPKCAVQAAFEEGKISPSRYDSYIRILESLTD